MKSVYTGLESQGKTYRLAVKFEELRARNVKWFHKYGFERTMALNFPLSESYKAFIDSIGHVKIRYFEELDELLDLEGADIFIDEMLLYFDARNWPDLSLEAKRWLTQGGKRGNDIYGACQDFSQVDKMFRLLTDELFMVHKICGNSRPGPNKPPVKRVWGFGRIRPMNPKEFDDENKKFLEESILSIRFFRFKKKYTDIFNTNEKIMASNIIWKSHKVEKCKDPNCTFEHSVHR